MLKLLLLLLLLVLLLLPNPVLKLDPVFFAVPVEPKLDELLEPKLEPNPVDLLPKLLVLEVDLLDPIPVEPEFELDPVDPEVALFVPKLDDPKLEDPLFRPNPLELELVPVLPKVDPKLELELDDPVLPVFPVDELDPPPVLNLLPHDDPPKLDPVELDPVDAVLKQDELRTLTCSSKYLTCPSL